MNTLNKLDIVQCLQQMAPSFLIEKMEEAMIAISENKVNMPPVGHLGFHQPPGDVHIKYGHIEGDSSYVIKIASGFYENEKIGLSNSNGMMLAFSAHTGELQAVLLDEGYLTDQRTAIAGAAVAKHMAPKNITGIGVIGTGIQARLQLHWLETITNCREVFVYGRSIEKTKTYMNDMGDRWNITTCDSPAAVAAKSNLIVTTTPASHPLLFLKDIQPGTHITAMGSDTPGKQELDERILSAASVVACDSISQCVHHGEAGYALRGGLLTENALQSVGSVIQQPIERKEKDITVADLTGIATQDIKITLAVLAAATENA